MNTLNIKYNNYFINLMERFVILWCLAFTMASSINLEMSQPSEKTTRVACLGDSITEGFFYDNSSYPMFLSSLLNSEENAVIVRNFGKSGIKASEYI
jgi:hypothetical protein